MIHCLHGNVSSPDSWDIFHGQLGDDINALDLWSMLEPIPLPLIDTGQKIAESANKGDVILGYSMGGRLALHALLADPEKWKAAIIISAHPGLQSHHRERLHQDEAWANLAESNWESFLLRWNSLEILQNNPHPTLGFHQTTISRQLNVAQAFRHWSLGTQDNLLPSFPKLTCPILWITGTLDPKYTHLAQQAIKKLPHALHISIPNAGHRVPWDQTKAFSKAIRTFLSSLDPLP